MKTKKAKKFVYVGRSKEDFFIGRRKFTMRKIEDAIVGTYYIPNDSNFLTENVPADFCNRGVGRLFEGLKVGEVKKYHVTVEAA